MFSQDSTLTGDVDCSGEVNSQDASLILQFVTNVIDTLPCQDNMTGLTPEQLQEIINLMSEQLNVNYTGGGRSNYPDMISGSSSETMKWGEALIYCDQLEENGYSDWFLPNLDQLSYALGGGCDLPDERTINALWTTTNTDNSYYYNKIYLVGETELSGITSAFNSESFNCRCVRFGEGETSENSNGSPNSSGSSVGGSSEQAITMIGPMYLAEDFPEFFHLNDNTNTNSYNYGGWGLKYWHALRFCEELNYDGFSDWSLPSLNQIFHFSAQNFNTIDIPNYSNLDYVSSTRVFWTSTDSGDNDAGTSPNYKSTISLYNENETISKWESSPIDVSRQIAGKSYFYPYSVSFFFCVI